MPHRIPRAVGRYVRDHLVVTIVALVVVNSLISGFAIYRLSNVTAKIVDVQVANCESGNVVRGHIQFLTSALHDLLVLSLAAPPRPNESAGQKLLRENFQKITDQLGDRLPALAPRDCDRKRIIDGVLEPPGQ